MQKVFNYPRSIYNPLNKQNSDLPLDVVLAPKANGIIALASCRDPQPSTGRPRKISFTCSIKYSQQTNKEVQRSLHFIQS